MAYYRVTQRCERSMTTRARTAITESAAILRLVVAHVRHQSQLSCYPAHSFVSSIGHPSGRPFCAGFAKGQNDSSAVPVIAGGVVMALSSVSDDFCGTTVALIVSPSTHPCLSQRASAQAAVCSKTFLFVGLRLGRYQDRPVNAASYVPLDRHQQLGLGTAALGRADHSSLLPYPVPNPNLHNDLAESTFGNTHAPTTLRSSCLWLFHS
jgi:hypothetical protein